MFPAAALADEMLGRGWKVILSSDARGLRYADAFPSAVLRVETPAATFARGGLTARLAVPMQLLRGSLAAWRLLKRENVACVAGFGGYPSLPALTAAMVSGVPRLIHEQNGVLGRVNRIFARRVNAVACGTWPLVNAPAGADLRDIGNPVRKAIADAAEHGYTPWPGNGPCRLLVMGGSQGARALSQNAPAAIAALPEALRASLEVSHQARPEDLRAVKQTYATAGITADVQPFFPDVPARMAAAHLVVSRAGASSVAEIAAMGRPSILIPYPFAADDHQRANASALETLGGAVVIDEKRLTAELLTRHITEILEDPQQAGKMATGAKQAAKPHATRDLADLIETLVNQSGDC